MFVSFAFPFPFAFSPGLHFTLARTYQTKYTEKIENDSEPTQIQLINTKTLSNGYVIATSTITWSIYR